MGDVQPEHRPLALFLENLLNLLANNLHDVADTLGNGLSSKRDTDYKF